jgi:molybdopterin-binding protein
MAQPASEAVARAIGVTNVYDGVVVGEEEATSTVEAAGVRLIGSGDVGVGQDVRVLVPAEAVTLLQSDGSPAGGSARNRWDGTVVAMESVGRLVDVVVDIGVPLRAILTPGSVDVLGLGVDSRVVAAVKASAVRIVER